MRWFAAGTTADRPRIAGMPLPPASACAHPRPADAERVAELSNAETIAALGFGDTTVEELLTDWSAPHEIDGPRAAVVEDAAGAIVAYLLIEGDQAEHEVFGYAVLPLDAAARAIRGGAGRARGAGGVVARAGRRRERACCGWGRSTPRAPGPRRWRRRATGRRAASC